MNPAGVTRVEIYHQVYALSGAVESGDVCRLAERVDGAMRRIARQTNVADSTRLAVLAALNLADENEALQARCARLEQLLAEKSTNYHEMLDDLLTRAG